LDFTVVSGLAVNPFEECVNVELIPCDGPFYGVLGSGNFWEVTNREALSRWSSDKVIGGVLIGVSSLLSVFMGNLVDFVDTEAGMGIEVCAHAIDLGLGKIPGADFAREELGTIEV